MQYRIYHHLVDVGPQTAEKLMEWYNHDRPQTSNHTKGAQHGSTIQGMRSVLRSSILFEPFCETLDNEKVWGARPLCDVVERAILSKRKIEKFPHFLQVAIKEKLSKEE